MFVDLLHYKACCINESMFSYLRACVCLFVFFVGIQFFSYLIYGNLSFLFANLTIHSIFRSHPKRNSKNSTFRGDSWPAIISKN